MDSMGCKWMEIVSRKIGFKSSCQLRGPPIEPSWKSGQKVKAAFLFDGVAFIVSAKTKDALENTLLQCHPNQKSLIDLGSYF